MQLPSGDWLSDDKALEKIDQAYDSPSWWYDVRGFFILTFSYRDTLWHQVRFFNRNISNNHLEVAIGSGSLLGILLTCRKILRMPIGKIAGFDYAERMLVGARKRFGHNSNIDIFRADAGRLDVADGTYDSANIANAFHCFPEPEKCMKELFRILKSGGKAAVNVVLHPPKHGILAGIAQRIADWGIEKGILFSPYSQEQALTIFKASGFAVEQCYVKGYALNAVLVKP